MPANGCPRNFTSQMTASFQARRSFCFYVEHAQPESRTDQDSKNLFPQKRLPPFDWIGDSHTSLPCRMGRITARRWEQRACICLLCSIPTLVFFVKTCQFVASLGGFFVLQSEHAALVHAHKLRHACDLCSPVLVLRTRQRVMLQPVRVVVLIETYVDVAAHCLDCLVILNVDVVFVRIFIPFLCCMGHAVIAFRQIAQMGVSSAPPPDLAR